MSSLQTFVIFTRNVVKESTEASTSGGLMAYVLNCGAHPLGCFIVTLLVILTDNINNHLYAVLSIE